MPHAITASGQPIIGGGATLRYPVAGSPRLEWMGASKEAWSEVPASLEFGQV